MKYLALIISVFLYGCGDYQSHQEVLFNKSDYVFRCETMLIDTSTKRITKYKPVEILKGQLEDTMFSDDGYLNFTRTNALDVSIGSHCTFYIQKRGVLAGDPIWGFSCEYDIIYDISKLQNHQLDPIVTTPVDEVEAQGTQGHQ